MLLIFALSITPKVFLHDLTADHKDEAAVILHCHDQHVSPVGFTCDCNNLVSTSPYTVEPSLVVPVPQVVEFASYCNHCREIVFANSHYTTSLRGPPAA